MTLVSIIIPCYNCDRFLEETVNSVFQQTFTDYEIILIDDGSTDKTAEIIKSFGSRVKSEFQPNLGASVARNKGTALAKGDFIQYLDADDLLKPDALQKRITALKSSGADVAYSDWQKLIETAPGKFELGEIINRKIEDIHPDIEIALFTSFWSPPAALLYHRSIVDKIGSWNESLPIIQDARFLLDAGLQGGKFVYVPGVGAEYRIHHNLSLSRRNPVEFVKDCYRNGCQVQEFWQNRGELNTEQKKALAQLYDYTARTLLMGDRGLFQENLTRLYAVEPDLRPSLPKLAGFISQFIGINATQWWVKKLGRSPI
jgi:glycosyltransferase involved in cell wall biosynthesis